MATEDLGLKFKFGFDGTGFQQGVSAINRELKVVQSEFQASSAKLGKFGDETDKLELKAKSLSKQMDIQKDAVKALESAYEKSVQTKGKDAKATQELEIKLNKAKKSLYDMEDQLKQTNKQLGEFDKVESKFDGLGNKFSDMGSAIGDSTGAVGEFVGSLVSSPWTAIAAGIGAVGTAAITTALEFEKADGRIQASLGVTKEEAEELGKVAQDVWNNGWGESIDEVSISLVTVSQNLKDLPKEELKQATEYAQILAEAFDKDVSESTRSANQLMKTFGLTGGESFDFITKGMQDGLNYSDEFLDVLWEYSPQFQALGMDASDMFTLLKQGADNGAISLDKVGDLVKEFNIRVKDGSKSTEDSFAGLSKNTQKLWDNFKEGKVTGEEVFNAVIKDLNGMEDEVKANQLAVGIFGTQWEDLESDVVAALDTSVNKLGEFEGATEKAGEALSDNISTQVSTKLREMQTDIGNVADKFLYFALVTGEKKDEINDTFNLFGENVSKGTEKAITGFMNLNNKATEQIIQLQSKVGNVSKEMADNLKQTFADMATNVKEAITKRQEETITTMQELFAKSNELSEAEEKNVLDKMVSNYETRKEKVAEGEKRINEILELAKNEKRGITDREAQEITAIKAQMKNQAIDIMTESEAEQKSIMERLKAEAGNISAKQAADVVKNSLKQKNETVKAAEEQYDKTVQEIIRQRDETKSITKEQADKLIGEAKRQKDVSVQNAEIMHKEVVKEAKKMAGEQVDEVNWGTGEMKKSTEKFVSEASKIWEKHYEDVKKAIEKIVNYLAKQVFQLPSFKLGKMPHFSIKTSTKSIMGEKFSYPSGFDVDWYDKGGIFTGPQIIGVGEKRPEFVGALDDLKEIVRGEMKSVMNNNGTSYGNIYVTIPAKDIKEFQDVTDFFKRLPQVVKQI
jgi:phage-related minor tail protein